MDIQQSFDASSGTRIQTVEGVVTPQGLLAYLGELYASAGFDPGTRVLWDFRRADLSQFDLAATVSVRDLVEQGLARPKPTLAALVVANESDYSLTQMFQTLISSPDVSARTFFDVDEAMAWLNGKAMY